MIRNVVIHISNEQPLQADLFNVPTASDAGLVCTNLRMLDGKRPIFIDDITATFFFPYLHIRFLEIPPGALARHLEDGGAAPGTSAAAPWAPGGVPLDPAQRLPVVVTDGGEEPAAEDELDVDVELEIDEDFLQRVRDI